MAKNQKNSTAESVLNLFKDNPDKEYCVFDVMEELKTKNTQGIREYVNRLVKRQLLRVNNPDRASSDPIYYQWSDELLEMDLVPDSMPERVFEELVNRAVTYRTGEVQDPQLLMWDRSALEHTHKVLNQTVVQLKQFLDNPDLWAPKTLVERLGYLDEDDD